MTRDDVAAMTHEERAELARWLAEIEVPPELPATAEIRRRRRLVLTVTVAAAAVLIPWTIWLSIALPRVHQATRWRGAWVGFDVVLIGVLAATAWCGWNRRQAAVACLLIGATLLVCDAWFDVVLSSGRGEQLASIATALVVELPLSVLFLVTAYRLMRATAVVMWRQQGREGPVPSLWELPILATPMPDR